MNAIDFTELVNRHPSVRGFVPLELQCSLPALIKSGDKWLLHYFYYSFNAGPEGIALGRPVCVVRFSFPGRTPEALFRVNAEGERGHYSEALADPAGCVQRERAYLSELNAALAELENDVEPSPEELPRLREMLLSAAPAVLRDDYREYMG